MHTNQPYQLRLYFTYLIYKPASLEKRYSEYLRLTRVGKGNKELQLQILYL